MYKSRNKKIYISAVLLITFTFFIVNPCFATDTDSIYVWSNQASSINTSIPTNGDITEEDSLTTQEPLDNSTGNFLNLESGGAILIEQTTGKVLYEHNSHEKLRPASVTKVMSLLLIMEALDEGRITLEDKIPCSQNASSMGGSQIWLDVKEELTVDEMLKAICVVSANDCTVAMAEYLYGSEEIFVQKMNQRAKELGMNDTTFLNCHGIDEDGHVTSAYDISLMSKELLNNHPNITKYTTIWMDTLRDGKSELVNTNRLIRNYKGATGLKTGSTSVALYNLSASATRDGLSLISVIMKSSTSTIRFNEAQKLLDYGFGNYSFKEFAKQDEVIKNVHVDKGIKNNINAIVNESSGALIKKGQEKEISQTINLPDNISAPITKGETLGEIIYELDGELVGRTDIVASEDVPKTTLWNMTTYLYEFWFTLCR